MPPGDGDNEHLSGGAGRGTTHAPRAGDLGRDTAAQRHESQSDDPAAAFSLGVRREERGDLAGAAVAYRRADEAGHAGAACNLGVLLETQNKLAAAEAAYARADQRGDANGAFNLGALLEQRGALVVAEAAYRRAHGRGHPAAAPNLGVLLAEKGDVAGAETVFRRAGIRIYPDATSSRRDDPRLGVVARSRSRGPRAPQLRVVPLEDKRHAVKAKASRRRQARHGRRDLAGAAGPAGVHSENHLRNRDGRDSAMPEDRAIRPDRVAPGRVRRLTSKRLLLVLGLLFIGLGSAIAVQRLSRPLSARHPPRSVAVKQAPVQTSALAVIPPILSKAPKPTPRHTAVRRRAPAPKAKKLAARAPPVFSRAHTPASGSGGSGLHASTTPVGTTHNAGSSIGGSSGANTGSTGTTGGNSGGGSGSSTSSSGSGSRPSSGSGATKGGGGPSGGSGTISGGG